MNTIVFEDTKETFNIMARDNRYLVCSRIYTVDESYEACCEYDKGLRKSVEFYYSVQDECNDFEDYFDTKDYLKCLRDYEADNGNRPIEYEEDTQCYTLVDLQDKIRGADNFYNKYNYLDQKECDQALLELNRKDENDLCISRRNRLALGKFEICQQN